MKEALKMWGLGLTLGGAMFATADGADEKSYVIPADRLPPAGTVAVADSTTETPQNSVSRLSKGREQSGTEKGKLTKRVSTTFDGPDKFTREMTDYSKEMETVLEGRNKTQADGPNLLLKVPVVFERKDGQWIRTLADGAPLSEDQIKELGGMGKGNPLLSDKLTYGEGPHKIGDKWEVDVSKLPGLLDHSKASGSVSCELVEAKEVQGLPAVVVKITIDYTEEGDGARGAVKLHMKGESIVVRCTGFALELESKTDGVMELEYHPNSDTTTTVSGPTSYHSSTTVKMP